MINVRSTDLLDLMREATVSGKPCPFDGESNGSFWNHAKTRICDSGYVVPPVWSRVTVPSVMYA